MILIKNRAGTRGLHRACEPNLESSMLIDLTALRATPLVTVPYPHVVVPGFVPPARQSEIAADFPKLAGSGLFLAEDAECGPSLQGLLEELESEQMRVVLGEKLGLDLYGLPLLVTLRGRCAARDGRIHADAKFKLATVLLYLNEPWAEDGGRLRVLNSPDGLDDYAAEVAPDFGTLVAFRVQENSWHGHKPFKGPRRYVMINYCADAELRDREAARHRVSARVKSVRRLFAGAPA